MVYDKSGHRYAVWRALLTRAILQATQGEYNWTASALLKKKRKKPLTVKKILRKAQKGTTKEDDARASVRKIAEYFLIEDVIAYAKLKGWVTIEKKEIVGDSGESLTTDYIDPLRIRMGLDAIDDFTADGIPDRF